MWHNAPLVEALGSSTGVEVIEVMGGYMARNDSLVAAPCERLVAFPEDKRPVARSGTWATIRRAERRGIPVDLRPLRSA